MQFQTILYTTVFDETYMKYLGIDIKVYLPSPFSFCVVFKIKFVLINLGEMDVITKRYLLSLEFQT
jgi:hypothetical protein